MLSEQACRDRVWERDESKDRATGVLLDRASGQGQVHHLKGRRVMPEWVRDPDHQVLLSVEHHRLATGVWGGRLLQLRDPDHPNLPATDATKPILFIRVDKHGLELWRRIR